MERNNLKARVVKIEDLGRQEIEIWNNICRNFLSLSSPFYSPHYARAVADAGNDVRVCILLLDEVICGFLPFQFANQFAAWTRAAEPVGANMTDYFGVIADPCLSVTTKQLLHLAGLSYFGFSHLPASQLAYGLEGEQPRTGLRIRLHPFAEDPLAKLLENNRKYYKDTERRERQLGKEVGPMRFEFDVQENRQEIIAKLIESKRAQYSRTNASDALKEKWKQDLLLILSRHNFDTCRGVLSTLFAGEEWVAIHFGIFGNGVLQYWLPVYNPSMAKYAPGRLLIHQIIKAAVAGPINIIDRGEGDTASKRELANEEHLFYKGVWHDNSAVSGINRGIQSLKWRLSI